MPRETFFNLTDDKRNKILEAAREEFTEHELFKARVSNIIKNAEIPRGSFYQYFEDLEDLYYFVIDELFDSIFIKGSEMTKTTSNVFEFMINTFEFDYDAYTNDKRHRFMMNVMKSISDNEDYLERFHKKRVDYIMSVLNELDLSDIKFTSQDDLVKMYQMMQDIKRNVIRKSLIDKLSKEEALKEVSWYIDVLKNGLLNK